MNAAKTKDEQEREQKPVQEEAGVPSEEDLAAPDVAAESVQSGVEAPTLEAAVAERDANYDRFLRVQAELENYRKRVRKETEQNRLYQALPLVRDLLPGLDNLERALIAAESSHNVDELIEGVRMVAQQFQDVLARHSTLPIDAVGKPFDPNLHEAIQQLPSSDHPPMTVIDEVQRGYMLHDRVVRPSTVIVSSSSAEEAEPPNDPE